MRKLISRVLVLTCCVVLSVSCMSCGSRKKQDEIGTANYPFMEYLGDYDYTSTPIAMVYEEVEDEPGFYGIQYRRVDDLGGLSTQEDIAICLYFYSSLNTSSASLTAGVEDLAQTLKGRVLFVAIDVASHEDISEAYDVYSCPEFILINKAARISTFDSASHDYWSINDVASWLNDNGFAPDYSLLD